MTTHSSTLAWKVPWTEEPGRLQSMGSLRVRYDWATSLSLSCIGEGNGNPLQYSCLENPRTAEPGGLLSMGSHRVGHDWSDLAAAAAYIYIYTHTHTNTYTEGEEGVRGWDGWMESLMQCTWTWANFAWHVPWGHKESDMIGWLNNDNTQITLIYIMFT